MNLKQRLSEAWHAYDAAIWVRAFGTALMSLTNFMMRPFLVLYLYNQMEESILLSMLIVGLSPFFAALVSLFAGGISDRLGRKPVMLASLVIQAVTMLAYIAANSIWHFAILSILSGAGHALFHPAANAQVSDVVPEDKRQEVFALFHTALNLGAALGPLAGLALYSWNMHVVFLTCAVSTSIYAAAVWWKVPETLPDDLKAEKSFSRSPFSGVRLREHKLLLWIALLAMPVTLLYAQVETTFPLHLQTRFEDYRFIFATLMTFNGSTVILLQMWIANRTKDLTPHRVITASYALFALVALGYGFAPWFVLLLVVELVFTIGEMMYGPHMQKLISVISPPEHRGFYFSVYGMNWQLARAIGPILGGFVFSRLNGESLFLLLTIVIFISGLAMTWAARKAVHPKHPAPDSTAAAGTAPAKASV